MTWGGGEQGDDEEGHDEEGDDEEGEEDGEDQEGEEGKDAGRSLRGGVRSPRGAEEAVYNAVCMGWR